MGTNIRIVISYSWKDKDFVEKIDKEFQAVGITFIRDERDLKFKVSIKEYMHGIRNIDYVLIIISDSFLKTSTCMYETIEFLKDPSYNEKILLIILEDAKIYNTEDKQEYIKYWADEYQKQFNKIEDLPPSALVPAGQNLKHFQNIKDNIGEFIDTLQNFKSISYDELEQAGSKAILDRIGHADDKLLKMLIAINSISDIDEKNEAINKFIQKNSYYSNGYHLRGTLESRRNKYWEAINDFTRATELDDNFTEAYYSRGIVHFQRGDREKAIKDFKAAAKLGSTKAEDMLKDMKF